MSHLLSKSSQFFTAVGFSQLLTETNGWDKTVFAKWVFARGMLFQATEKWWGDMGRRVIPHEGLDLCLYEDLNGKLRHLDETTAIPTMFDCRVVNIMDDFLGKTIMMEHRPPDDKEEIYYAFTAMPKSNQL